MVINFSPPIEIYSPDINTQLVVSEIILLVGFFTCGIKGRGEPIETQTGIAFSILNRVARPAWWGNDVMSVIFKKWQFSSLTDPNDKQLTTWPASTDKSWIQCLQVACDALDGVSVNPVPGADSYYDISIPPPKWATDDCFVAQIGKIRFFDLNHDIEHPRP